jgi:DNA-binding GntR family transcriptional regulator
MISLSLRCATVLVLPLAFLTILLPLGVWPTVTSAIQRSRAAVPVETTITAAGYEQVYDIDEIITRMRTPAEVARLNVTAGTPVAEHIRTGYTADNRPVRVMVSIIPGDTLILQYTIPT